MLTSLSKTKSGIATLILLSTLPFSTFGHAQPENDSHAKLDIKIGQAIFEKLWVFAPASTKSSDGLGPLYNASSCQQCHHQQGQLKNNQDSSLVIQLSIEPAIPVESSTLFLTKYGFIPEPVYGKQLQTFAYPGGKAEATISVTHTNSTFIFEDGDKVNLKQPKVEFSNLGYGPLSKDLRFSPRIAPRIMGLAWIDSLPAESILANADPEDLNQDGISGKANWVWNKAEQKVDLGRFGWKASKATLDQQNLAALATDIGISSWLFPQAEGDCTLNQTACIELARQTETHLKQSPAIGYEATKEMTDLLLLFTASHGNTQIANTQTQQKASQLHGEKLFKQIGCQTCHISHYDNVVNKYENDMIPGTFSPYSDLLLHDMGEALSDHRNEFLATGREWRTAPLWGISKYLAESPNPAFLHDGRASSIIEAILWHDGEAASAKQAFTNLSKENRQHLIQFVESL